MAFAETGFGKTFAAFGPVPAEQLADRLPAPEAGVFYVVAGADSWLRQQTLRRLADHHLGEPPAPFRLRRFDGRTANADQVVSATRTVSFSGAPVVLIENGLRIAQPPASVPALAGVVLELLDRPPGRAVIALEWERNPDRRRKDWKALASSLSDAVSGGGALVLDCDAPPPARMTRWIRRTARERGLNLPEQGAELLFERFGRELRQQVNEIEKLAAHRGDEPLAEALRVPRRVADDLERAARRFRPAELRAMLRQLAEMDLRMKTTRVPDRAALSSLALLLGRGSSGARRRRV